MFEKCIRGLLRKKSVLLVSHLINYVQQCDSVLLIEKGEIKMNDSFHRVNTLTGSNFALALRQYASLDNISEASNEDLFDPDSGRNSMAKRISIARQHDSLARSSSRKSSRYEEEVPFGQAKAGTLISFLRLGSSWWTLLLLCFYLLFGQALLLFTDWWLSKWVDHSFDFNQGYLYPVIYASLALSTLLISILRASSFFKSCVNSSKQLFESAEKCLAFAPLQFYNSHPPGRILK